MQSTTHLLDTRLAFLVVRLDERLFAKIQDVKLCPSMSEIHVPGLRLTASFQDRFTALDGMVRYHFLIHKR